MLDVKTFFEGLYQHVPWTFSAEHPLTDLEFADDTVLMARTQATLHRLVHLLQHLAAQRGLSLNPHKCQLLLLNTTLPISLSKTVTATDPCSCEFCAPFLDIPIEPDSLAPPVPQMDTAKYLGAFISSNSSSTADVNFRCSQASTAFHALSPFFRHPLIHPKKKFQIYSQIVQAILLHGAESQVYSPAQVTKINSLHYKALRQILQVKSPFYHRVLSPSEAPCSNEHLIALAYAIHPSLFPPSLRISNTRLKYLGHILRHPESFEHQICFHSSYSLRTISSPFRKGAPRAHWPELALAEASNKVQMITRKQMPAPGEFLHEYYQLFTIHELKNIVSSHMPRWYNTTPHIRRILPVAQDRELWKEPCTR
jgi:hypothetical protein